MQTFLPFPNFGDSAAVLDRQRLGKQRVEGYQILRTLLGFSTGWQSHPAVIMWRGYEHALGVYTLTMCLAWHCRGYNDTIRDRVLELPVFRSSYLVPPWLGDERLHISHQSNLIRKDPTHYRHLWPDTPADLEYFWPGSDNHYLETLKETETV